MSDTVVAGMTNSIWDVPGRVRLNDRVAVGGDWSTGCLTIWVEGHGQTLTNEETTRLLALLSPTQAQIDADYEEMFRACDDARASFSSMSHSWANIARHWKAEADRLRALLPKETTEEVCHWDQI